ncbi:hypothetical protein [Sulfurimonas sp.]|uniref:hypothetical protein n=1 Tax=Sulfurimonas sp. TaxID=2022749 RepID=UPI002B48BCB6|nr:hypothetical protein [Sulfurimonas sp.]
MEKIIVIIGIISITSGFLVWTTLMQKKGLKVQQTAIDVQAEANEREKKIMQHIEETLQMNKEQLEEQKTMSSLLKDIRDELRLKS